MSVIFEPYKEDIRNPLQRKIDAARNSEPSDWLTQGLTDEEIQACIEEGRKQRKELTNGILL